MGKYLTQPELETFLDAMSRVGDASSFQLVGVAHSWVDTTPQQQAELEDAIKLCLERFHGSPLPNNTTALLHFKGNKVLTAGVKSYELKQVHEDVRYMAHTDWRVATLKLHQKGTGGKEFNLQNNDHPFTITGAGVGRYLVTPKPMLTEDSPLDFLFGQQDHINCYRRTRKLFMETANSLIGTRIYK